MEFWLTVLLYVVAIVIGIYLILYLFSKIVNSKNMSQDDYQKEQIERLKASKKLREIENSVLKNLHFKETILSTGGSAVYSDEAMKHIQKNSKVIFLDVSFREILERVPSFLDRGFAKAPSQSIEDAFEERQELYNKYSHHIVSNTEDLHSCVSKIIELL